MDLEKIIHLNRLHCTVEEFQSYYDAVTQEQIDEHNNWLEKPATDEQAKMIITIKYFLSIR